MPRTGVKPIVYPLFLKELLRTDMDWYLSHFEHVEKRPSIIHGHSPDPCYSRYTHSRRMCAHMSRKKASSSTSTTTTITLVVEVYNSTTTPGQRRPKKRALKVSSPTENNTNSCERKSETDTIISQSYIVVGQDLSVSIHVSPLFREPNETLLW